MLGGGRLEAQCFDGEKRLGHIRGKLRKKVWINQGDIILLSLREFQDDKADVILKYSADEARSLKAYGELPENAKINETETFGAEGDDECHFEFEEEVEVDDIDDVSMHTACKDGREGKECIWDMALNLVIPSLCSWIDLRKDHWMTLIFFHPVLFPCKDHWV